MSKDGEQGAGNGKKKHGGGWAILGIARKTTFPENRGLVIFLQFAKLNR